MSSRRRRKNSLLGVRVCAPWKDGYFYSGVIEAVKSKPTGENTYTLLFDDGYIAELDEEHIVGPGFKPTSVVPLKSGQRVYVPYKGREVAARVIKNRTEFNEILVQIPDQQDTVAALKPEEVHLVKGQKYLWLSLEEKCCKTGNFPPACPVPCKIKPHGIKHFQSQENLTRSEEMAALVLTALSISPVPNDFEQIDEASFGFPLTPDSGSEMVPYPSPCSYSPGNSPLPSCSPIPANDFKFSFNSPPSPIDEGIGVEIQRREGARKRKNSTSSNSQLKTLYKCTWPGCGKTLSTAPGIIRHVRTIHLGPRSSTDEGLSDGEEDFYFNEIELDLDEGNDGVFLAPLAMSPPPTQSHFDMVKSPWSEPGALASSTAFSSLQNPRFNWDLQATSVPYIPASKTGNGKSISSHRNPHHANHNSHRKVRGESKKCRKVYGMENRHLWCTQCRWKKACVRFAD